MVFHIGNCSNYASHRGLYDLSDATDESEKLLLQRHQLSDLLTMKRLSTYTQDH